ncbi:methylcytosine dioxygenase TET-like [Haliotis cracherodii]|uniref:methylcytosine dioxygenase TET-like n=1 Tax=Haliotis cracherodii TaxID=6455 RepID=UPI0039E8FE5C
MEQDRTQAEVGWGRPGMTDARSMIDAMQDPAYLAAMAAHSFQSASSQAAPMSLPSSLPSFNSMAGSPGAMGMQGRAGYPGGGDMPMFYPNQDNAQADFRRSGIPDAVTPNDAQLNLKRRISQLVQMRAMQQTLFGAGGPGGKPGGPGGQVGGPGGQVGGPGSQVGSPGGFGGAVENPSSLFRAQSLPQLHRGDNPGGSLPGVDGKDEAGLWKTQSQKDLQYGSPSPRSMASMMMSAPSSPLARPLSRPASRQDLQDMAQSPQGFKLKQEVQNALQQQQQQQQLIGQQPQLPHPKNLQHPQQLVNHLQHPGQQPQSSHHQNIHHQQLANQQHQLQQQRQQQPPDNHQQNMQQQQQQHPQHPQNMHGNQQHLFQKQVQSQQKVQQQQVGNQQFQTMAHQQQGHGSPHPHHFNMQQHHQQLGQQQQQGQQLQNHGNQPNLQEQLSNLVAHQQHQQPIKHPQQMMQQQPNQHLQRPQQAAESFKKPSPQMLPPQAPPQYWTTSQGNQDNNILSTNSSYPSLNAFVTTTASSSTVMSSGPSGAPASGNQMFDPVASHTHKPTGQPPSPKFPGNQKNMLPGNFDQQFQNFKGVSASFLSYPVSSESNFANSVGFPGNLLNNSEVKNTNIDGQKGSINSLPDAKPVNAEPNKPKKTRKPKAKVEKTPDKSKISDLMASDIDRKLLAMFPQYHFYLDQNTKPMEDVMPLPAGKKLKKKRPANLTPEGEPKKKKKVKKKVDGVLPEGVPQHQPGFPKTPLLASEAAPLDTDLSRQQQEDKKVAQILAAIKDPKSEAPPSGNPLMNHKSLSSAKIATPNSLPSFKSKSDGEPVISADPFQFEDDDDGPGVILQPSLSKKSAQESKLSQNENLHHLLGGSSENLDKFCCNHCEETGDLLSLHCQNKHSQNSMKTSLGSVNQTVSPHSEGSQKQQVPVQEHTPTSSTYHNTQSLSFSQQQSHSAGSTAVTTGSDPLATTTIKHETYSVSVTPADTKVPLKDYILDQGPQTQANPLANLQASVQNIFDDSSLNHFNGPRLHIPPEMLNEYLNKTEGNLNSKIQCGGLSPNKLLSSKNADFLSTSYSPPHDIKPVPPSVPSALNQSKTDSKIDVKLPELSPGMRVGPEGTTTPQTTPTKDKNSKVQFNIDDDDLLADEIPIKLGSVEEELFERLKNNKSEVPHCDCLGPNYVLNESIEGPYYTQLGSGPDIPSIRKLLEERTGTTGNAIRIEKIIYTGKEGKSSQGCPVAKWIIRRSSPEEKYLCVARHRPGHFCAHAYIISVMVAWDGVQADIADDLYSYLSGTVTKLGFETERRCGTNERKTCACQGVDLVRRGASFSFGCSWSMYFNGCKYARSRDARKFKLKDTVKETELEERLQNLASMVGPLYETVTPDAHRNQCQFDTEGGECRLGANKARPFSGVTACVDFCAHAHKDLHNMNNGSTVVVTLTKHRGLQKPEDEQLHVLPLYVLDPTDESGSVEGQREKIRQGCLEVLTNYPLEAKMRAQPLTPKKRGKAAKKDSPNAKKKKEQEPVFPQPPVHNEAPPAGGAPAKEQQAMLEHLMKKVNNESISFEDLMSHSYLPGFNELYGKFWDYFYANGTFPPGTFLSKWAANKMSFLNNQKSDGAGNHFKMENNQMLHNPHHPNIPNHNGPPSQGQHLNQGQGQQNGMTPNPQGQGVKHEGHKPFSHHPSIPQNGASQEQHQVSSNSFSSPLDMLSTAAIMQNGDKLCANGPGGAHLPPQFSSSQPVPSQPGPMSGQTGPPHPQTTQDQPNPSGYPAMQHRASSLPQHPNQHSSADGKSDCNNPAGFNNRAPCNLAGTSMCNGGADKSALDFGNQNRLHADEPNECMIDPTVVKCEWEYNEEVFRDPNIGGVAIALGHGAVLFEVAKRELHATTALKNPNRYHPTRISLVFYQHKNLNYRHHGWYENERKMEMLRQKKLEKMKDPIENEVPVNGAVNGAVKIVKKKKKKETVDFAKTSAAQYKYMWDAPVRHGVSLTTDSIITRWIDPQPMVSGPYQRWV